MDRRAKLLLLLLAAVSAARVLAFGVLDRRPLFGGWEAPDLQRSMFYHYGLRGHLDWTFAEQIARDGFKPPLWYGGVPVLFGWKDSLSAFDFLAVNAVALVVTMLVVAALASRIGGPRAALPAAVLTAALPGIAWRVGMIGVEQTHMALLPLAVLLCLALLKQAERSARHATIIGALLGAVVGASLLVKWNFGAYIALPLLLTLAFGLSTPLATLAGLATAAAVSAGLFLAWMLPYADLQDILQQGAVGESDGESFAVYVDALRTSLGPAGLALLPVAVIGLVTRPAERPPHPLRAAALVLSAIVGLLALHALIPHKESRYLLPALPLLAVLLAGAVAWIDNLPGRVTAWLLLFGMLVTSWMPGPPPPSTWSWAETLRFPVQDDYGIDAVLAHPSLRERERTVVTFALSGEGRFPLLTFLHWELYGRNPNPVLSRSDWDDVTSKACAFDLERSTHFLTSRPLDVQEEAALRSMGFERVIHATPRIADVPSLALWALDARSAPRYR